MRKLLVVLAVLLAVGLFAGAGFTGNWNFSAQGTVTILVDQWADITYPDDLDYQITITDYDTDVTLELGEFRVKSNGSVTLTVTYTKSQDINSDNFNICKFTLGDLELNILKLSGSGSQTFTLPFSKVQYPNGFGGTAELLFNAKNLLPANMSNGYQITITVTVAPTI